MVTHNYEESLLKSADIRKAFLEFFKERGHTIVPSSSLVPASDPTLLFTNAGMVQFKDLFLGREKGGYTRATTSQRCVRAGGKHNDLENVGYTARHHTFFEMMGNFSFGDYFKKQAIQYAWEFLTQVLKLPQEKLWITVFEEDDEAADIWLKEIKIDPSRFSRCGEKDNFWAMGDTGPCGPCSEIFYDHGPEIAGEPPGYSDDDGDRYIEIWNLVFMQYNRAANGEITPLPKPSVDTGMGLERIAAVMQGVHNNYDIDIFQHLIKAIATLAHVNDLTETSLRVIADHIRATAFLITDGVMPSNEGRGYVLRRIIRRAIRHGNRLGLKELFFYKLVVPLVEVMGEAYPELSKAQQSVEKILLREEELFATTLSQGLKVLEQELSTLEDQQIPGNVAFKLYDTYGFPIDLTADIAREKGLIVDDVGFHQEMAVQRQRSQEASQFAADYTQQLILTHETEFTGYEHIQHEVIVTGLFTDHQERELLKTGESGIIVLDKTPFYAESGGQVGDKGLLLTEGTEFVVEDTQKQAQAILHYGKLKKGEIKTGEKLNAEVDSQKRRATALNHSATHLLNATLRHLLGDHVKQKGSLVEPERLRFDFSHFEPLHPEQNKTIERLVNEKIRANLKVETKVMTAEEAMDSGAVALFGEKYGAEVRVLCMGDFSMELCGGTHVSRTGDIGLFKIISESGIASGIRRIEAVTGNVALDWINRSEEQLDQASAILKVKRDAVIEKIEQSIKQSRNLEKEVAKLKSKLAGNVGVDLTANAHDVHGIKVLATNVEHADVKTLRDLLDKLKNKLGKAVIVLACQQEQKLSLIAGVTKDLTSQIHAGELVNYVAAQVGGKGGGRADMAQAGGDKPEALADALASVTKWVEEKRV